MAKGKKKAKVEKKRKAQFLKWSAFLILPILIASFFLFRSESKAKIGYPMLSRERIFIYSNVLGFSPKDLPDFSDQRSWLIKDSAELVLIKSPELSLMPYVVYQHRFKPYQVGVEVEISSGVIFKVWSTDYRKPEKAIAAIFLGEEIFISQRQLLGIPLVKSVSGHSNCISFYLFDKLEDKELFLELEEDLKLRINFALCKNYFDKEYYQKNLAAGDPISKVLSKLNLR